MVVIMTNATALNLRMTLHSNFGLGVATITVGICSSILLGGADPGLPLDDNQDRPRTDDAEPAAYEFDGL